MHIRATGSTFELPVGNIVNLTLNGGVNGCGFFCSLSLPHLKTVSQQVLSPILVSLAAVLCFVASPTAPNPPLSDAVKK